MGRIAWIGVLLLAVAWLPWLAALTPPGWTWDSRGLSGHYRVDLPAFWQTVATLTTATTAPDVDARDYDSLAALGSATWASAEVPRWARYGQFRFQITADADQAEIYGFTAGYRYDPGSGSSRDQQDRRRLTWDWTVTGGTQVGPNSNVFADTIACTEYHPSVGLITDAATNRICVYDVDVRGVGYIDFVLISITSGKTVKIDVRWYQ